MSARRRDAGRVPGCIGAQLLRPRRCLQVAGVLLALVTLRAPLGAQEAPGDDALAELLPSASTTVGGALGSAGGLVVGAIGGAMSADRALGGAICGALLDSTVGTSVGIRAGSHRTVSRKAGLGGAVVGAAAAIAVLSAAGHDAGVVLAYPVIQGTVAAVVSWAVGRERP